MAKPKYDADGNVMRYDAYEEAWKVSPAYVPAAREEGPLHGIVPCMPGFKRINETRPPLAPPIGRPPPPNPRSPPICCTDPSVTQCTCGRLERAVAAMEAIISSFNETRGNYEEGVYAEGEASYSPLILQKPKQ